MSNKAIEYAKTPILSTPRLLLRSWRKEDLAPFAELNADPEVMEFFPWLHTREESDQVAITIQNRFRTFGFGFWAVETVDEPFVGFVGLSRPSFDAHFTPAIEIGWRLARSAWGKGYASEAARAALEFAFGEAGADEVVSFTPAINARSIAVMERIGMTRDAKDDFDHPKLEDGPLRRFVLYRITREMSQAQNATN